MQNCYLYCNVLMICQIKKNVFLFLLALCSDDINKTFILENFLQSADLVGPFSVKISESCKQVRVFSNLNKTLCSKNKRRSGARVESICLPLDAHSFICSSKHPQPAHNTHTHHTHHTNSATLAVCQRPLRIGRWPRTVPRSQ